MQSRRDFLVKAAAASAAVSLGLSKPGNTRETDSDLCNLSATAAVRAMKQGDISAENYAHALLRRSELQKSLNAFITMRPESVIEAARDADQARRRGKPLGLLHGLPIPVKDSVNSRTLPTSAGTEALRDFQPTSDAPLLSKLFAQGGFLLGKTNLHELSLGYTTNNATFGACHNPYDTTRSPGGSSGGSATAVAARMAPLAVAEDTLGSIRVPAAQCGIAGLRPSINRYAKGGIMPISSRFDTGGAVARSIEDLILFDTVMYPQPLPQKIAPLTGIRLGIPTYYWNDLDVETERVCRKALDRLRDSGAILTEAEIPAILKEAWQIAADIISFEVIANESAYLLEFDSGLSFADFKKQISLPLRKRFDSAFTQGSADALTPEKYTERLKQLAMIRPSIMNFLHDNRFTAVVFPTTLSAALKIGEDAETKIAGHMIPVRFVMARNVALATCAGIPGLSLPAGLTTAGLPVGLEFDAGFGEDRRLLQLGLALERSLGPIVSPTQTNA